MSWAARITRLLEVADSIYAVDGCDGWYVELKAGMHVGSVPSWVPFHWSMMHAKGEPIRDIIWRSWLR